jgi:hypothetical protein
VTAVIGGTTISENITLEDSIVSKSLPKALEEAQEVMLDYWSVKFSYNFQKNCENIKVEQVDKSGDTNE